MVVARDLKSSISGTENVMFAAPMPRRALADVDEAIFAAIDQRTQQDAANDAEDRGVGADAEASVTTTVAARPLTRRRERTPTRISCPESAWAASSQRLCHTRRIDSRRRDVTEFAQRGEARGFRILAALIRSFTLIARCPRISSSSSRSSGRMATLRAGAGFMMRPIAETSCDQRRARATAEPCPRRQPVILRALVGLAHAPLDFSHPRFSRRCSAG